MRITILYESSWRNSFLDGSNNEPLPKDGRKYVGSMTELKKEGNFKQRHVEKDTVMGILNRLIGDQRKLYQARADKHYYFSEIEPLINFKDDCEETSEIVYLRNISGSTDQNSFSGVLKSNDLSLCSDYSQALWGVLGLDFEELIKFILDEKYSIVASNLVLDPLVICDRFNELSDLKDVINEGDYHKAVEVLHGFFPDQNYCNNKGLVVPSTLYCSALYLQLERLSLQYDLSSVKTKSGGLSGISKRGFTKKDFMKRYSTGNGKLIYGNPYMLTQRVKGLGEVTSVLTKANGKLEIEINIDKEKATEIKNLIESAGVSAFYLGKKGLAYVSNIRL